MAALKLLSGLESRGLVAVQSLHLWPGARVAGRHMWQSRTQAGRLPCVHRQVPMRLQLSGCVAARCCSNMGL